MTALPIRTLSRPYRVTDAPPPHSARAGGWRGRPSSGHRGASRFDGIGRYLGIPPAGILLPRDPRKLTERTAKDPRPTIVTCTSPDVHPAVDRRMKPARRPVVSEDQPVMSEDRQPPPSSAPGDEGCPRCPEACRSRRAA